MRILGIEFGSWSVKAVEMESRFRRFDILDFHEIRLPLQIVDPGETYKNAVAQLLARLPSHPEKIITSLPTAQTALRFLRIPLKQRKKVEKMYRFELEDSVPFRLEDSIVEHHVMRFKEGSLVFAAIAPKKFIQAHIEWLRTVGIDPDWLTFEGMGIANLYLSTLASAQRSKEEKPGPVLLLDIGHQKTNLVIFDEDRLQLFRTVGWGGAAVTQSLAMSLAVSSEEAEQYKMNDLKLDEDAKSIGGDGQEILIAAAQTFGSFLADINHSLVAYRSQYGQGISRVLLTGGTSKIWGIRPFLSRALGVPVEPLNAFDGLSLKEGAEKGDDARFGEPLGRALVFARKTPLLFNFRKDDMGKETSLTEVTTLLENPIVTKLLKYVAVLAILLFVHVHIAGFILAPQVTAANTRVRKVFQETFREVPAKQLTGLLANSINLKKFIDQKLNELDQKIKMLSRNKVPMLSLIRNITESFPPEVKVDVNNLQLDDRTFLMEGVLYEGDINRVTESLKKVPTLSNVTLSREMQRFTYRGELGRK